MYVMDLLSDSCDTLDINADRIQAMMLRQELVDKNAVLESIILEASFLTSIDDILASQGLDIDTVMGADTADIDLSQYIACGIDTSALDSDIADVNFQYRRCKVLEMSAEIVLTDALVDVITLRDSGSTDIDEMLLDLTIDEILD